MRRALAVLCWSCLLVVGVSVIPQAGARTTAYPCKVELKSPVFSYPPTPTTNFTYHDGTGVHPDHATGWAFKVPLCLGAPISAGAYQIPQTEFTVHLYDAATKAELHFGPNPDDWDYNAGSAAPPDTVPGPCLTAAINFYSNSSSPPPISVYLTATLSGPATSNATYAHCGAAKPAKATPSWVGEAKSAKLDIEAALRSEDRAEPLVTDFEYAKATPLIKSSLADLKLAAGKVANLEDVVPPGSPASHDIAEAALDLDASHGSALHFDDEALVVIRYAQTVTGDDEHKAKHRASDQLAVAIKIKLEAVAALGRAIDAGEAGAH